MVEGLGDHGCEYMTGGRVVVIGITGRNFAAGMRGGISYGFDQDKNFRKKCNMGMVQLEELDTDDKTAVHDLLRKHLQYTQSPVAKKILDDFSAKIKRFIKVMPIEYKRIIELKSEDEKLDLIEVSD